MRGRAKWDAFSAVRSIHGQPHFSPDGRKLMFSLLTGSECKTYIHFYDLGQKCEHNTETVWCADISPLWSPDLNIAIFASSQVSRNCIRFLRRFKFRPNAGAWTRGMDLLLEVPPRDLGMTPILLSLGRPLRGSFLRSRTMNSSARIAYSAGQRAQFSR